jgi:transposase
VRWTYNKSIESLNSKEKFEDKKLSYALRNKFVTVKGNHLPDWTSCIPKEVRKTGTDEAAVAWKNRSDKSTFDFRKKKDKHQSLAISSSAIRLIKGREDVLSIFKRTLGEVKCNKSMFRKVAKKKGAFSHDSKLTFNGTNYFLHVPYEPSTHREKEVEDIVGLDPGVRTFLTGYSPKENQTLEYKTDFASVWRMKRKIELSKTKKEKWKNENLLTDQIRSAHIAVAKDLTSKFSHLILGKFDTQKLTEKAGSKLSKKTRVEIGCLSHYKFRERLSLECFKSGSSFRVVPEHFTSKTCGGCGEMNQTLGASKVFECKECGGCFDRDVNAARNMLVKYLVASKV